MVGIRLTSSSVQKPWGRAELPFAFEPTTDRVGEVWFNAPSGRDAPLLVKYLFTSERLSLQVHPDDRVGRMLGLAGGKSECWYVLEADPSASLGIGLLARSTKTDLEQAALDGSIVDLIDWKPGGRFLLHSRWHNPRHRRWLEPSRDPAEQ